MKILIILKNAGNTGKSQSLKYLTDILETEGNMIKDLLGSDYAATVERYGRKIGVITIGDPGTEAFVFSTIPRLIPYRSNQQNVCPRIVGCHRPFHKL